MSLTLHVAGQTDLGCVRANNEDSFGYDWRDGIYVVCDGMGGEAAGEVASRMGVESVLAYCRNIGKSDESRLGGEGVSARASVLAAAIRSANEQIHSAAERNPEQRGMGSTITAVLVEDSMYSIAHVGDSRIYLLRDGTIRQLTQDHSLVMEHVRRGLITMEEAQRSELQNIITRALGSQESVEPDLGDMSAKLGDTVLLATDGLTRHVSDDEILRIVEHASSCEQACEQLIDAAKRAGGHDNITCLILQFSEKPWLGKLFDNGPTEGSSRSLTR